MATTVGIAKRLTFEDLSMTLNQMVDADDTVDLKGQLLTLLGECEAHSRAVEDRSAAARDQASKTIQQLGSRALLKRQLQSLKSSLQSLGQKANFSNAILTFSEEHDYRAEAELTAAALESAEEDLKDLKKANHQDEGDLCRAIRAVESRHEQLQACLARLDQSLEEAAADLATLGSCKLPLAELVLPEGVDETCLEEAVSDAQQQALKLENKLAQSEANCQDLEGDLAAHDAEMARMQAEITQLRAARHDEARAVAARHTVAGEWCDGMAACAEQLTGASIERISKGEVAVTLVCVDGVQRTVTAQLGPSGIGLVSATVTPADNIEAVQLVEFARASGGGLPLLLNLVRAS